jgi:histidine triad (HIT) family protein
MPSIFSRIISGELPAQFVFRDGQWVAFLDIKATSRGHLLLVPRCETAFLADLPPEYLASLGPTLARVVRATKRALAVPAANVVVNDGAAAGQVVPHVHFHIIPRSPEDGGVPFQGHYVYTDGEAAQVLSALQMAWAAS